MSPLLGFQERFAQAVEHGANEAALEALARDPEVGRAITEQLRKITPVPIKRQTIRALRADGRDPKPGDTLYLWTGLRRPGARKLGEATCQSVMPIHFYADREILCKGFHEVYGPSPQCDDHFAKADGFASFGELIDWIDETHGLPFEGLLIRW